MTLHTLVLGAIATNCYLLEDAGEMAVIDPAMPAPELFDLVDSLGGKLKYILLTHGHFDHILGVAALKARYPEAVIAIHPADADCLHDPQKSLLSRHFSGTVENTYADKLLRDEDRLPFGADALHVLHTPGHTPGSVCCLWEGDKRIFSGDTLFCDGYGRVDFPGGSLTTLRHSLQRLANLPGDWRVYPGHEEETTLAQERGMIART